MGAYLIMKKSFLKRSFLILFQQNRTSLYLAVFFAFISSFACQGMNEPREKRKRSDDSSSSLHQSKKRRKQSKKAIYRPKESFDRKKSEPQHTFFIYPDESFQRPKYLRNEQIKIVPMSDEHRFYPIDTFDIPEESLPNLTQIPTPTPVPEFLANLKKALDQNDIFTITQSFDNLIKHIPQALQTPNHNEGFYHSLIHTLLRFTNYTVCSDIPTGSGEADTYIRTADNIYLFEFKINQREAQEKKQKSTVLNALKQIFENDYYKQNHQDDVPMTLAGISFHGISNHAKIKDNFTHLSCASLELKKDPKTLRAYPFAQPEKFISDHNEAPNYCTHPNWNQFRVQKDAPMDDSFEEVIDESYSQINTYHPNLRNIQKGFLTNDVPLIVKNIECILHAIPWSLRKFNCEYFQAIIYTSLLCAELSTTVNENTIEIETDNYTYKFICDFSSDSDTEIIQTSLQKKMIALYQNHTSIKEDDLESKPEILIMLNINQPPRDGSNASKIQLISQGIIIKNRIMYQLDGKTKIKSLKKALPASIVITSPHTVTRPARPTIFQEDPPSPYQPPRARIILKETIQEDDNH